ncbi:hypothetical protein M514_07009 [Trichuris suis]|uniref:Uncharacterized protein n=1 Tax=Trichuris suis TaxID=68888 RepID=A0A085M4L8_9BILA|nr:hypothetical protein M513_07009 [Trichuris suis]KFD65193.1 hypothetical protein M514_07009 [Trichuris suis]KHJ44702.1 hypothetical protein D918_04937 [Trichuris suis]
MPTDGKLLDLKLIPQFDGSSQPVAEWLEKAELVCGITDIARVLSYDCWMGRLHNTSRWLPRIEPK